MNFYKTKKWKHKRKEILKRDNNECQKCKSKGRYGKGECVHHIKHLKYRPDLALNDNNLITLCNSCHNEEHPEKLPKNKLKTRFISKERW